MSERRYTDILAEFASATPIDAVPQSANHAAKRLILDTLGCAIGGGAMPSSLIVDKVVGAFGGHGEATVLASGKRLPVALAAHINAHTANALDAEDTTLWAGHLSACTVMPALAMAERMHSSGAELLAAVAIAFDVVSRIGLSMKQITVDDQGNVQLGTVRGHGWAAFGATAGAGRLLGLDSTQMLDAFGLTGSTAPLPSTGHWLYLPTHRPMSKYSMYGSCAEAGVIAALFAKEGFTSDRAILDGDTGLWRMYGSPGVDWSAIPDRIGRRWLIEETSFKLYPACRFSHPVIDMAYELRREMGYASGDIEMIEVGVPQSAFNLRMNEHTIRNSIDTQYSIPYLVALAFLGVEPGPHWHSDEMRERTDVAALSAKVHVVPHPGAAAMVTAQLRKDGRAVSFPFSLSVTARGQKSERSKNFAKGDPWAGAAFSDAELKAKFEVYCKDRLAAAQSDALYNIVMALDKEASLERLMANIASAPSTSVR